MCNAVHMYNNKYKYKYKYKYTQEALLQNNMELRFKAVSLTTANHTIHKNAQTEC